MFDLLHSGHIAFLQRAAGYGDLHVAIGSDKTMLDLRGRLPVNSEQERLFRVRSAACVKEARISRGSGYPDFLDEFLEIRPDVFVVNEDGNTPAKAALCAEHGVEYVVLKREPYGNLVARSTSELRARNRIPYRLDIAGGWLDQPFVSRHHEAAVIPVSLEADIDFNERSGMGSSTRRTAIVFDHRNLRMKAA
jgi:cytidyltransferase-like protein